MANKIYHENEWYIQEDPRASYEIEFERSILSFALNLFPSYWVGEINAPVYSEEFPLGGKISDFILVDKAYRDWWVVEVELSSHSFASHIEPQVLVLSTGRYRAQHKDVLIASNYNIDPDRFDVLMRTSQPKALLIIDSIVPEWGIALQEYASVLEIKPYRSGMGKRLFHCNGVIPEPEASIIINLDYAPSMPTVLSFATPARIGVADSSRITIQSDEGGSEWIFHVAGDKGMIQALEEFPLSRTEVRSLSLVISSTGEFRFKKTKKRAEVNRV